MRLNPRSLRVSFRGFKPKMGSAQFVAGESPNDRNTFDTPDKVRIEKALVKVEKCECAVVLNPHSVTIVKIQA